MNTQHDPTFDIPDPDPARFTFADGDMLEPVLLSDDDEPDAAQDAA